MKKFLCIPIFMGISSISATMVPSSLTAAVQDLQLIADKAAAAGDKLPTEDQVIVDEYSKYSQGIPREVHISEVKKLAQMIGMNSVQGNRTQVHNKLKQKYDEIQHLMDDRLQQRRRIFSEQLNRALSEARSIGLLDTDISTIISNLIEQSQDQPVAGRFEWILGELHKKMTEKTKAIATKEAQAADVKRLNQVATVLGMQIQPSQEMTMDKIISDMTTRAEHLIQTVQTISPGVLEALKSGNFYQAQTMAGGNATPEVQQALAIGQEAIANALRTVGQPVPDLEKKMDMIREIYGDDTIDTIEHSLNKTKHFIIDVIGYTLIIESKNDSAPLNLSGIQQYDSATRANEFDASLALFFANNYDDILAKLKGSLRETDQSSKLQHYVIRKQRKTVFDLKAEEITMLINPLLKQQELFNMQQFDKLAITLDGDKKFALQDNDLPILFRNHYKLLNDAAAVQQLSQNASGFIEKLRKLPKQIQDNLRTIEENVQSVSNAIQQLPDKNTQSRIQGIIDRNKNIVDAIRHLLDSISKMRTKIIQKSIDQQTYKTIEEAFTKAREKIVDFYSFLQSDSKALKIKSETDIAKLLKANEDIISDLLMQSCWVMENILIESLMPRHNTSLKENSIINFIDTLNQSLDMFLDKEQKKQAYLTNDAASYSFKRPDGVWERIYGGELCAQLASASIKLLKAVYNGGSIKQSFADYKGVIDLISQVQQIGAGNDSVAAIIQKAKGAAYELANIKAFCVCLSEYNKAKANLQIPEYIQRYIPSQFVTTTEMGISSSFRSALSKVRTTMDDVLRTVLSGYNAQMPSITLEQKIAFLVDADYGILNGIRIGIPFNTNFLIKRPHHAVQMEKSIRTVQSAEYLFHGQKASSQIGEISLTSDQKKIIANIINHNNNQNFTDKFKKRIDDYVDTINKANRAYIPHCIDKNELPVDSSSQDFIIVTPHINDNEEVAVTLALLDAAISNPKVLGKIRDGSIKRLFGPTDDEIDLKKQLIAYVSSLREIKQYLNAQTSPKYSSIDEFFYYKGSERLSFALDRIKNGLEQLAGEKPIVGEKPIIPESRFKKMLALNLTTAANLLVKLPRDQMVDLLRNQDTNRVSDLLNSKEPGVKSVLSEDTMKYLRNELGIPETQDEPNISDKSIIADPSASPLVPPPPPPAVLLPPPHPPPAWLKPPRG